MNVTPSSQTFINEARKKGLTAGYSGKEKAMLVNGPDAAVKSFLRLQCLKGKKAIPFSFKQGTVIS